ncbi:MAG: MFS transporter [Actinobacteria bacterium]|nr:MFS transporter [Actinomycetota bacterium]MCB9389768.1 MFS transporter [Acidimicrobiia bacterium]
MDAADRVERHDGSSQGWIERTFGSRAFFNLWISQVGSSLGDWIGIMATISIAGRVAGEVGTALTIMARVLPGLLLAPVGGVLADRWDRKRTMVVIDFSRALVFLPLLYFDNLFGLILIPLLMEILAMLWAPAKEASVPHLVPRERLEMANSLSLAAMFGVIPVAALIFAILASISDWLAQFSLFADVTGESLAIVFDSLTYVASAMVISRLAIPRGRERHRESDAKGIPWGDAWRDIKEGIRFVAQQPAIRGVMLGMSIGLLGGASIVSLGERITSDVLGAGPSGYGLLNFGVGLGAAFGVASVRVVSRFVPQNMLFAGGVAISGIAIILASLTSSLAVAVVWIGALGFFAAPAYVTGLTILHARATDDIRGRTFAALNTVVRLSVFGSLVLFPALAGGLDVLSRRVLGADRTFNIGSMSMFFPGSRLALLTGGIIAALGGLLAARAARTESPEERRRIDTVEPQTWNR